MRNGARLVLVAGNRFTGTLTSPKVSVPDQKGRGPDWSPFSSPLYFFLARGFALVLAVFLGSAFLLFQCPQTLLEHAVE
jgi:hypothetical protein